MSDQPPAHTPASRPDNRSVENENMRPGKDGEAPRPATEPVGSEDSTDSPKTETDPGSGEQDSAAPA